MIKGKYKNPRTWLTPVHLVMPVVIRIPQKVKGIDSKVVSFISHWPFVAVSRQSVSHWRSTIAAKLLFQGICKQFRVTRIQLQIAGVRSYCPVGLLKTQICCWGFFRSSFMLLNRKFHLAFDSLLRAFETFF